MDNVVTKEIDCLMAKCSEAVADQKRNTCLAQLEALVKTKKRKKEKKKSSYFLDKSHPKKQRKKVLNVKKPVEKGSCFFWGKFTYLHLLFVHLLIPFFVHFYSLLYKIITEIHEDLFSYFF